MNDAELYRRGADTLLASWEGYARAAQGAALRRLPGVTAAVFPSGAASGVYNNALLGGGLGEPERARAIDAMEGAYAAAGVRRFAAWVHEGDPAVRTELERRGYVLDETTRVMGMALEDLRVGRPRLDAVRWDWTAYVEVFELPAGLLSGFDAAGFV